MLTYGSLFTGAGGLEMGLQSVLPGRTIWHSDIDPGACKVLEHRWPDVPNLGDVTRIDWPAVPRVDVLTGGYPCQPFSLGGKRAGTNDERRLWPYVAEAIAVLRPGLCVFENVRGHLSLGFDEVLRDLHQLGYSVRWYMLRAADTGAPHGRARIFIFAEDTNEHRVCGRADRRRGLDWDHEQIARGDLRDQPQGQHVGQGKAGTGCPVADVRRSGDSGCGCDGGAAQHLSLATDRQGCRSGTQGAGGASRHQGEAVSHCPGSCGDGRGRPNRKGRGQEVESRDERASSNAPVPHPGGESEGAGPEAADTPEREAGGGVPARLVVGTGRGSVRPGGVRGEAPDVRTNGCWACVRDVLVGGADGERDGGAAADTDGAGLRRFGRLHPERCDLDRCGCADRPGAYAEPTARGLTLLPTPRSSDANGAGAHGEGGLDLRTTVTLLPTPRATDGTKGGPNQRGSSGDLMLPSAVQADRWGKYAAAIARWERILGRPAPDPTKLGRTGNPRLNPELVEWMMGWPPGHITAVPGVTDPQALRICGNGVVPQQAAAAMSALLSDLGQIPAC